MALYISTHENTQMITDITTAVIGQYSAGKKNDSTRMVKIMPVIILCFKSSLTFFLG